MVLEANTSSTAREVVRRANRHANEWSTAPAKYVTLEKYRNNDAPTPTGTLYSYSYKSLTLETARARAATALLRDVPGEHLLDWKELTT